MGYTYALFGGYWTKSFAKGGQTEISREQVVEALRDPIEEMMEEIAENYEAYDVDVEEIEYESRAGFIPFTDGGISAYFIAFPRNLLISGNTLPTNTLEAQLRDLQDKAYE